MSVYPSVIVSDCDKAIIQSLKILQVVAGKGFDFFKLLLNLLILPDVPPITPI